MTDLGETASLTRESSDQLVKAVANANGLMSGPFLMESRRRERNRRKAQRRKMRGKK